MVREWGVTQSGVELLWAEVEISSDDVWELSSFAMVQYGLQNADGVIR
jgi:hypothetical protein